MSDSSTVRFARPITAAAGVYAPGHIGELTQYLPFELVDDVLSETKTVQRRLRDLPSRVGVYFVLALMLFPRLGYPRVWQKLTAGLRGLELPSPSEKALRDLRRRLGQARSRRCSRSSLGRWDSRTPQGSATAACAPSPSMAATRFECPTPSATVPGWAVSVTGWASPAIRLCA